MVRRILFIAVITLFGCKQPSDRGTVEKVEAGHEPLSIPFEHAVGFRDGFLLKVPREGGFLWNGGPVKAAILSDFVQQYAHLPTGGGRLWIEFEPGVSPQRAAWVRRQVVESGLCRQHRCAEEEWNAKRPVVY